MADAHEGPGLPVHFIGPGAGRFHHFWWKLLGDLVVAVWSLGLPLSLLRLCLQVGESGLSHQGKLARVQVAPQEALRSAL